MDPNKEFNISLSIREIFDKKIEHLNGQLVLLNKELQDLLSQKEILFREGRSDEFELFDTETNPSSPNFKPSQKTVKPFLLQFMEQRPGFHLSNDIWEHFQATYNLPNDARKEWIAAISSSFNHLVSVQKVRSRELSGRMKEYEYIVPADPNYEDL